MNYFLFITALLFSISTLNAQPKCKAMKKQAAGTNLDTTPLKQFDPLNRTYYKILVDKFLAQATQKSEAMSIFEPGLDSKGQTIVYPTAIASPKQMEQVPLYHHGKLGASLAKEAKQSVLWVKKMQAGTGSSLTRQTFLAKILGVPEGNIAIGAKGTDLHIEVKMGDRTQVVSLAEIQILQSLYDVQKGHLGGVVWHDIVGPETRNSLASIWQKPSLVDPTLTYAELIDKAQGISRGRETFQDHMPIVSETAGFSFNSISPAGHGLFAVEALIAAYKKGKLPKSEGKTLISSIGNGEDLSSTPDARMIGLMREKQIPIAMVTTTKTNNDLKGGQIALAQKKDGSTYITIVEKAQAEASNQLPLFEQLGLRKGDAMALFNTNMVLFNYEVLAPKIRRLVKEVGEARFLEIIAPDLIVKPKEVESQAFTQLEGAMGSVILNLDKFWREKYGEPLVSFINVDAQNRTQFFSPIKSAFDFFLQFHSDRFRFDNRSMKLVNRRPGFLPEVELGDKIYKDVQNVLDAFAGTKVRELDQLRIDGAVYLPRMTLKGKVTIANETGKPVTLADLKFFKTPANRVLENVSVRIKSTGEVELQSL